MARLFQDFEARHSEAERATRIDEDQQTGNHFGFLTGNSACRVLKPKYCEVLELREKTSLSALGVSLIAFAVVLAGAFIGAMVGRMLPKHHLDAESKDMIKVGVGFLATLAALVLGLLIASAKSSFDTRSEEVQQSAAKIVLLDRNLRQFGAAADPARDYLRQLVTSRVNLAWMEKETSLETKGVPSDRSFGIEEFQDMLRALIPADEAQRLLKARLIQLSEDLANARWLLIEQIDRTVPMPFLVVLVVWLAAIAGSLSLFAPRNGTVMAVNVVCALSFASAIFLILEMDTPFKGLLKISDAPLRNALAFVNR